MFPCLIIDHIIVGIFLLSFDAIKRKLTLTFLGGRLITESNMDIKKTEQLTLILIILNSC